MAHREEHIEIVDRTDEYLTRDPDWRIEAVIHDGCWYDVKKWSKVAKVKPAYLEDWIKKNKRKMSLIRSERGHSYRVSYKEVIRWYSLQTDIAITDKIIPKNFPPRLWGGMTETEAFLNAPLRNTSTLTFETGDSDLIREASIALSGVARIRYEKSKYRAYGLSDEYMRQVLLKSMTPSQIEELNMKKRKHIKRRELTDFDPVFIEKALTFYLEFAEHILKSHMATMQIYLPEKGDVRSQIVAWIIEAMRKFDETHPVPFSGYLSRVLRFWPYDLPDEALGKELSRFQRNKSTAIRSLQQRWNTDRAFTHEELSKEMDMDLDEFIDLNSQDEAWKSEKNATTLNYSDSSNEKAGRPVGASIPQSSDTELAHHISMSVINAALSTGKYQDAGLIINAMDRDSYNVEALATIDDEFKGEFARELEYLRRNPL